MRTTLAPSTTPSDGVTLPSNRAFLVQFTGRDVLSDGRAEHLASGTAIHFDSWTILEQFVKRQLEKEPS